MISKSMSLTGLCVEGSQDHEHSLFSALTFLITPKGFGWQAEGAPVSDNIYLPITLDDGR